MEDLGSMWSYQESLEDVKQSLLYKTLELESVKAEANEKLKKCREDVDQLINLLRIAYQERDEAKENLQTLLNKICPIPESPILLQTKANSSITESNSLSDTYNPHCSSPVDSFFHDAAAVTSPEFQPPAPLPAAAPKFDPFDAVVDDLLKGKTLPQQGKLLQTVMEAGPLLNTLMVAGPLPRWRNPPKIQTFKIPPVSIKGCDGNFAAAGRLPPKGLALSSAPPPLSCSSSASILNFGNSTGGSGSGLGSGWSEIPAGKRQRFQ